MVVVIIVYYSKFNDVVFFFYRFPIVKVYENARIFSCFAVWLFSVRKFINVGEQSLLKNIIESDSSLIVWIKVRISLLT